MLDISNNYAVRQFIGEFFEKQAARIFEAKMVPSRNFANGDIHPDLECEKLDAWIEVKATQETRYFKVYLNQVEKYRSILESGFPFSKILYAFFSHRVFNISRDYADVEKLSRDLVVHTTRIVVLDFGLVLKIAEKLTVLENYADSGYPPFYKWDHTINIGLDQNPNKTLAKFGIDPMGVTLKKAKIGLAYGRARAIVPITIIIDQTK